MRATTPRPNGRPTSYDPAVHPELARQYGAAWKTRRELAEDLKLDRRTIFRWLEEHTEFRLAYKLGRREATSRVEKALFARAIGCSIPETRVVVVSDGQADGAHVEKVEITTHLPPDVSAIKTWLTNRRPKHWAEKVRQEHTGRVTLEQLIAPTGDSILKDQEHG